jgi:TPR repeat protein
MPVIKIKLERGVRPSPMDELDEDFPYDLVEEWTPTPEELEREIANLTEQAEAGNPHAMLSLADILFWGVNESKIDCPLAHRWYKKAAEHGLIPAIFGLGMTYISDDGVELNEAEAIRLFEIAGHRGDYNSCSMLASIFEDDLSDLQNRQKYDYWLEKAELAHEAGVIYNNAIRLLHNGGEDYKALELLREAQRLGSEDAAALLEQLPTK